MNMVEDVEFLAAPPGFLLMDGNGIRDRRTLFAPNTIVIPDQVRDDNLD
jgi:hypothetical protein